MFSVINEDFFIVWIIKGYNFVKLFVEILIIGMFLKCVDIFLWEIVKLLGVIGECFGKIWGEQCLCVEGKKMVVCNY